jgi:hypothetical protein
LRYLHPGAGLESRSGGVGLSSLTTTNRTAAIGSSQRLARIPVHLAVAERDLKSFFSGSNTVCIRSRSSLFRTPGARTDM